MPVSDRIIRVLLSMSLMLCFASISSASEEENKKDVVKLETEATSQKSSDKLLTLTYKVGDQIFEITEPVDTDLLKMAPRNNKTSSSKMKTRTIKSNPKPRPSISPAEATF